jgi:hypothetical protein
VGSCLEPANRECDRDGTPPHLFSMELATHLVRLPDEWAIWKTVCLRTAGFPAALASVLTSPMAATSGDAVLNREDEARRMVNDTAADQQQEPTRDEREPTVTDVVRWDPPAAGHSAVRESDNRLRNARETYRRVFADESLRIAEAVCDVARIDRFREAIVWQNRTVLHTAIRPMLRRRQEGGPRNAKQRERERLVAKYLQRYALKNESIGFFGPVGWAHVSPSSLGIMLRPGPRLLIDRHVYFETWAIDALAEALSSRRYLANWLIPRRTSLVHLEGRQLVHRGRRLSLQHDDAELLEICDGTRTANDIAAGVTGRARLQRFLDNGWITLDLQVPVAPHADQALHDILSRIGDPEARTEALGSVTELQEARAHVAESAGDPERLEAALADLERRFDKLTGSAPRVSNEHDRRRSLVYEDCRRDVEVSIGRDVIEALGPPLALLLTSARWLTFETVRRSSAEFVTIYQQLSKAGSESVSLERFLERAMPLVLGRGAGPLFEARSEFRERWARVLNLPADRARVDYASAHLKSLVDSTFRVPGAGWQVGRYHSPDVMIAARSVADISRGDYLLVLGEMHVASNTIGPLFLEQHPDRASLLRAVDLDLTAPSQLLPNSSALDSRQERRPPSSHPKTSASTYLQIQLAAKRRAFSPLRRST